MAFTVINFEKMPVKEKNEIMKKILNKTLSASSEYYQIFIDNLNGDDKIKLHEIIKVTKPDELFKKCIDIDKELQCLPNFRTPIGFQGGGLKIQKFLVKVSTFGIKILSRRDLGFFLKV